MARPIPEPTERLLTAAEFADLPDEDAYRVEGGAARIVRSDDVLEGGDVLPGFRLPLAAFFAL